MNWGALPPRGPQQVEEKTTCGELANTGSNENQALKQRQIGH